MSHDLTDSCADIQPQLAAYALGETDVDAKLLDHLATCPACQRDLRSYVQVAWMLPYDAPDAAPPAALRERILAAVAAEEQHQQPAMPPVPPPAAPQRRARRAQPRWRGVFALRPAFALALAAIIVLLGWNISLQRQLSEQTAEITASRADWQTMIGLLNDPAVSWYPVAGDAAHGHLWSDASGRVACLVVQGMPALAADQVYQVWLIHGEERTNGGVFASHNGNGWILIQLDEPLTNYDAIGVSSEPRGGSAMPTGVSVLHGDLSGAQKPDSTDRQDALHLLALAGEPPR